MTELKENVISTLNEMSDTWRVAEGLKFLVQKSEDDNVLDYIIALLKEEASKINDVKKREEIEGQISDLERMRDEEKKDREDEEGGLDDMLDNWWD